MRWKNKCKYYDERKFYENWNLYTGDKVTVVRDIYETDINGRSLGGKPKFERKLKATITNSGADEKYHYSHEGISKFDYVQIDLDGSENWYHKSYFEWIPPTSEVYEKDAFVAEVKSIDEYFDDIKNPKHYQLDGLGIESKEVIRAVLGKLGFMYWCHGSALKYMLRAGKKDSITKDYGKAQEFLSRIKEEDEDYYKKAIEHLSSLKY